jgi:tetratricopeptide (TPR) repeat protein
MLIFFAGCRAPKILNNSKSSPNPMKIRTLLIVTLAIFTTSVHTFSQQQGKTAAEFEVQGVAAQRSGNCNEALKLYAEAIKIDPKSYIAQANSGNCYLRLEKPQLALGHLQVAVTLNPTDPLAYYFRSRKTTALSRRKQLSTHLRKLFDV